MTFQPALYWVNPVKVKLNGIWNEYDASSKRLTTMIKFRLLLMHKLYSVWLVALVLCMFIPYVWAAQLVDNIETQFLQFVVQYNRTYARNSTEYAKRLAIFAVSSTGSLCVQCYNTGACEQTY